MTLRSGKTAAVGAIPEVSTAFSISRRSPGWRRAAPGRAPFPRRSKPNAPGSPRASTSARLSFKRTLLPQEPRAVPRCPTSAPNRAPQSARRPHPARSSRKAPSLREGTATRSPLRRSRRAAGGEARPPRRTVRPNRRLVPTRHELPARHRACGKGRCTLPSPGGRGAGGEVDRRPCPLPAHVI